jgi:synaptic vesicle membrane protein VAT-1
MAVQPVWNLENQSVNQGVNPMPEMMKKVVIPKAGSYDVLRFEDRPVPDLGPDDVLIENRGIGVNYGDVMVRMGLYASAKEFVGWPVTPGFEFSGVVVGVGTAVTDLELGAEVFGVSLFNAYSTHVVCPRTSVFVKPDQLNFEEAAGFLAVYLTAYYGLYELAQARVGDHVLIHSAAGGVGGAMVALAKARGCVVTGVVGGSHKVKTVQDAGADHVIDKSTQNLWKEADRIAPAGFTIIADANGVATLKESYKHLRAPGRLLVYGFHTMMKKGGSGRANWPQLVLNYFRTPRFNPLDMTQECKSVLAFNLSYMFEETRTLHEGVAELTRLLSEGAIVAPPVKTYPFDAVAEVHRDIESGQTVGKLVMVP